MIFTDMEIENGVLLEYHGNAEQVVIPAEVAVIAKGVFGNAKRLQAVILPQGLEIIEEYAFYASGLRSIVIPPSVREIGAYAFADCKDLISCTLSPGLREIAMGAFQKSALESIVIPDSVTNIYANAFANCAALTSVRLPAGLQMITPNCFMGCALESIVIPDSVTEITYRAFHRCRNLRQVVLPSSLTDINREAFDEGVVLLDEDQEGELIMPFCKGIQFGFEQVGVTEEDIQTKLKALFPYTDTFFFTMTEPLTGLPEICYKLDGGEDKHLYTRIPISADMAENQRLIGLAWNNRRHCKKIIIGANAFSSGRCDIETIQDCLSYADHDLDMPLGKVIVDETYHTFVNTELLGFSYVYEVMLNYTPSTPTMTPQEAAAEALMQRMKLENITNDVVIFGELGPLDTEEKTREYITLLAAVQEKSRFDELMMFVPEQYLPYIGEAMMGNRSQQIGEIIPIHQREMGIEIYYWRAYDHAGDGQFQSHGTLCGIVNGYSLLTHEIALFACRQGRWISCHPAVVREFTAFGLWRANLAWFAGYRAPDTVAAVLLKKENRGEAPLSYEHAKAKAVAYAEYKW